MSVLYPKPRNVKMTERFQRNPSDRSPLQIRPLELEKGWNRYAEGSILVRSGDTHVLCTASVDESVPKWLKGTGQGWVSAEYSMLPRSTHTRNSRDREKVSGRTQEIQRLIGRALRASVDLKKLGERSIMVDCDVIQADGGTRTASITGGCVALALAISKCVDEGKILVDPFIQTVSAISVGIKAGQILVDLDYTEDSTCDVDMNFVVTGSQQFVEIQGTAERASFSQADMDAMTQAALKATDQIRTQQLKVLKK